HIRWTAIMGMQRSQSMRGGPSTFIYSSPAQESTQRRMVNQRFWALLGCKMRTSDIQLPPRSGTTGRWCTNTPIPIRSCDVAALSGDQQGRPHPMSAILYMGQYYIRNCLQNGKKIFPPFFTTHQGDCSGVGRVVHLLLPIPHSRFLRRLIGCP